MAAQMSVAGQRLKSEDPPGPGAERADSRWSRLLIAVLAVLIAYVIACYVLVLTSSPAYYRNIVSLSVPTSYIGGEVAANNVMVATEAAARGMSLSTYAIYSVTVNLLVAAGFVLAGLLILSKAQQEWFRWFTAFMLLFFPLGTLEWVLLVAGINQAFYQLGGLLWPAFLIFLYLFPNGRAVPRWSRWPMAVIVGVHFLVQATGFASYYVEFSADLLQTVSSLFVVVLIGFAFILFCQVYRYRYVSTAVERAQIKWFVATLALIVVFSVADTLISGQVLQSRPGFSADLDNISNLLIPASITIAILRYRLWDIDVIIRKTLIYTTLTAMLALVYFGAVVLLQQVFGSLTGADKSPLAIVISTLVIAALFTPLRRRIQDWIDRRFFRRKYDAQQVLAQFALTARDETDLDALTAELVRVVQETMQPESVSVWLVDDEDAK